MKLKFFIISIVLVFGFVVVANAIKKPQNSMDTDLSIISAYRFYKDINNISVKVPTVVEIPFAFDFIERFNFAVLDKTTNHFEPHFFRQETLINEISTSVSTNPDINGANNMIDKDAETYADFLLPENTQGQAKITLSSSSPITSSALTILLDNNVALPTTVEIRAFADDQNRIVVAKSSLNQHTVRFPQTTSSEWQITFTYGQPLRISELRLNQDKATISNTRAIRFLAQPDRFYRIYFDPDRSVIAPVREAGKLASAQDVLMIPTVVSSQNNPNYIIADVDNDGVPDIRDNCISVSNADQKDINDNARGDACDDFDQDGLINSKDNCPDNPNRDQIDTDSDGIGDICDKEESRITERYSWIPWVGIGFAAIVLIILFILMVRATYASKQGDNK